VLSAVRAAVIASSEIIRELAGYRFSQPTRLPLQFSYPSVA